MVKKKRQTVRGGDDNTRMVLPESRRPRVLHDESATLANSDDCVDHESVVAISKKCEARQHDSVGVGERLRRRSAFSRALLLSAEHCPTPVLPTSAPVFRYRGSLAGPLEPKQSEN